MRDDRYYQRLLSAALEQYEISSPHRGLIRRHPRAMRATQASKYKRIACLGQTHLEHRLVWLMAYGQWPDGEIDHINGDKQDNRLSNLRLVDHKTNGFNKGASKRSATGIRGIYKSGKKFLVLFVRDGRRIEGGRHETIEAANIVLRQKLIEEYGDEALIRINRQPGMTSPTMPVAPPHFGSWGMMAGWV